ncbi:hypothetical protein DM558_00420 [Entomomonas moraniae]|uniref:Uncharacterized protein n=1 Tax=Entomomonas moraniae TaxID=2213226 RepID=A0A3S9XA55_9GAMM|nr:hypothetical protein [Entomomonas moraniae]AZS49333.1 hypothetical protein DM558_00420 [Entomomonas moraniae]
MALTQEEIENTRSLIEKIWGKQIASTIVMNDDVVTVTSFAYEAAIKKSQVLYDMTKFVVEQSISLVGILGKGIIAKVFGKTIINNFPPLTQPLQATINTVAAQYRTPLMMAASGLGVWI